tara:strand:+ start:389 stop:829 length:441 start_codon:yes stop_codon:yes gene_type:complete
MKEKVRFIKPKRFFEVFEEISENLYDKIFDMKDRDLFYDRSKWIDKHFMWNQYKSTDDFDKDYIYDMNIETISILISQMVIFGRIIKKGLGNEYNLPKGEVPLYTRQIDEKGNEEDLYNIRSGKIIKNWSKKRNKKKIEEKISISK